MATPAEISAAASCYACIPNKDEALIYLLARISGVTDPATIAANATCYSCIPNKQEALLYLMDFFTSGGSGSFVTCGVGAPTSTPVSGCGMYIDTSNDAVYIYRLGAWALKV